MCLGYVFQGEEKPRFEYTEGAQELDPETLKPIGKPDEAKPKAVATPPPAEAAAPEALPPLGDEPLVFDDSALFGSLQARMQSLAAEQDAATDDDAAEETPGAPPPPEDTNWGSTAVLEPPGAEDESPPARSVFDGDSSVEFPTGFPLVDGEVEVVDVTPAASESDIAMLNRMFGNAESSE